MKVLQESGFFDRPAGQFGRGVFEQLLAACMNLQATVREVRLNAAGKEADVDLRVVSEQEEPWAALGAASAGENVATPAAGVGAPGPQEAFRPPRPET